MSQAGKTYLKKKREKKWKKSFNENMQAIVRQKGPIFASHLVCSCFVSVANHKLNTPVETLLICYL